MIWLMLTALLMGCVGSLHCIGMCGPIALSIPVPLTSNFAKFKAALLYNVGRVFTYAVIGAAIGLVGASVSFFGFQRWLSLLAGAAIIIYLIWPHLKWYQNGHHYFQLFMGRWRNSLSVLFKKQRYRSVFYIGILNGLLPCGLVYMAMATAIATGSMVKSSVFMAAFGLGTLPLMWALVFYGNLISMKWRVAIKRAYPYMLFIMALLLIIRGMGLGIPYVSPQWQPVGDGSKMVIECHDI